MFKVKVDKIFLENCEQKLNRLKSLDYLENQIQKEQGGITKDSLDMSRNSVTVRIHIGKNTEYNLNFDGFTTEDTDFLKESFKKHKQHLQDFFDAVRRDINNKIQEILEI